MVKAANLDSVVAGVNKEEPVVANAEPQFPIPPWSILRSPAPDLAKRCTADRIRIAVGLSRDRISASLIGPCDPLHAGAR
jgi:hypothetical protein